MDDKTLPSIVGSSVADFLSKALDFAAAGTVGTIVGIVLEELLAGRRDRARRVLLQEIANCQRPLDDIYDRDELVAIVYEYLHSAKKGAARLNLRIMAKVIRGQYDRRDIKADDFLRYADILSTLTHDEVVFLATLYRHFDQAFGEDDTKIYNRVREEFAGTDKSVQLEFDMTAVSIQRTGFVLPTYSAVGTATGFYCKPSPSLKRVIDLASFDDALREEAKG